jgi:hypothetical protein
MVRTTTIKESEYTQTHFLFYFFLKKVYALFIKLKILVYNLLLLFRNANFER